MKKLKVFKLNLVILFMTFMFFIGQFKAQVNNTNQQIVLQGFWWDYWNSNYPNGWANYLTELAPRLKSLGIDAVWIPPTIKSQTQNGVGYSPFDNYDLGDKYQKLFLKTRMGDKDEILRMAAVLKANGIDIIQDLVLNHATGAGSSNGGGGYDLSAMDDGSTGKYKNFRYSCYKTPATTESSVNYLSREGRFSKNWQNFYPNNSNVCCTNNINTPYWGPDIAYEDNAFGLSGNALYNPAQSAAYMRNNMRNWLIWYKKQVGWDGVRIDAIKHFPAYVTEDFLWNLQNSAGFANGTDNMFAVGEWVGGQTDLDNWANAVQNRAGTFDFSLRNAFTGIINGNGNFDLASVPNYQQQNRQRTVPFVNNHDTYRPTVNSAGDYTGWNTSQQLGSQIEPADSRSSICYAIALSVDGAPEIFFEDLFNLGYQGNRFSHDPKDEADLTTFSDVKNLIWCHQNLHFKDGSYLVRWQQNDALVLERDGKAIIAVTDNWDTWQDLFSVQTSFADGTVLYDYSGAHGAATITVYGGGKADITVPPCNGTATAGRKGYCVYAPEGIQENYQRPSKRIAQEWEMADDLGDSHPLSLGQGGKTPDNSLACRVVGRIFPQSGQVLNLNLYPTDITKALTLIIEDKNCVPLDSITALGNISFSYTPSESAWHTIKIRNATSTQVGQKTWVKADYQAPSNVLTNVVKNKCVCELSTASIDEYKEASFSLKPNPASDKIVVEMPSPFIGTNDWIIKDINGRTMNSGNVAFGKQNFEININVFPLGVYFLEIINNGSKSIQRFIKI
jgi:alpha-amylase